MRERETNAGAWPVTPDQERPRWDWTPLESVGPLAFGMGPHEVAAALDGEMPAARQGHYPWPWHRRAGQWYLTEERFGQIGLTAHYRYPQGVPALGAVTVHGRTGPRIAFAGIHLIGMQVSAVDEALTRHVEDQETGLRVGCGGDLGPDGLNMYVRAARAGDTVVSEARFCAPEWEDHG